jgi:hypothetical protein
MIANHVFRLQLLKYDSAVLSHQAVGLLMQKIRSLVTDASVNGGDCLPCFGSTVTTTTTTTTTTLATGKRLLASSQLVQGLAKVAGIANLFARRKRCEVRKPQVYTNNLIGMRQNNVYNVYNLNRKADIPVLTLPFDGNSFDLALHGTVQSHFERAYLGESEPIVLERPTCLRIGETIIPPSAFVSRIARRFTRLHPTEERLKGLVYPTKDILQYLTMYIAVFRSCLLHSRQLVGLVIVVQALVSHAVSVSTFLQGGVVQLSATGESPVKTLGLLSSRNQPELVSSTARHGYTFFWFSMYCFIRANGAPPTVETKYAFVHNEGNRFFK